jgi:hypothetical protein
MDTTRKTIGIDPKIVAQLVVSVAVWAILRYTGIDISAQAETLVALLAGLIAGWLAPAPKTLVEKAPAEYQKTDDRYQGGPAA